MLWIIGNYIDIEGEWELFNNSIEYENFYLLVQREIQGK